MFIFITSHLSLEYHVIYYTNTNLHQITGMYWPHTKTPYHKSSHIYVTNGIQDFVKCCIKSWLHLDIQLHNMLFGVYICMRIYSQVYM